MAEWCDKQFSDLPKRIQSLATMAAWDLHEGTPMSYEGVPYPGFVEACEEITTALQDIGDIWVDVQSGEVMTSQPDVDDEEDLVMIDRRTVLSRLVDGELAQYL